MAKKRAESVVSLFWNNLTSVVPVSDWSEKINLTDEMFFAGSCFASNLFDYLDDRGFLVSGAPFGQIYNPLSMEACLKLILEPSLLKKEDLFLSDGLYRHFDFHTKKTDTNPDRLFETLESSLLSARNSLQSSSVCFFTFGTSFYYRDTESGIIVNNCHKLPGTRFHRESADIARLAESMGKSIRMIRKGNPMCRFVLTVSPVRHLRDNPAENSYSKALLRCAVEEIVNGRDIVYFPAFEIVMDELRDYRWFQPDLSHLVPAAEEYILNRFFAAACSERFHLYLSEIERLKTRTAHRSSEQNLKTGEADIETEYRRIVGTYPELKLSERKKTLKIGQNALLEKRVKGDRIAGGKEEKRKKVGI